LPLQCAAQHLRLRTGALRITSSSDKGGGVAGGPHSGVCAGDEKEKIGPHSGPYGGDSKLVTGRSAQRTPRG